MNDDLQKQLRRVLEATAGNMTDTTADSDGSRIGTGWVPDADGYLHAQICPGSEAEH